MRSHKHTKRDIDITPVSGQSGKDCCCINSIGQRVEPKSKVSQVRVNNVNSEYGDDFLGVFDMTAINHPKPRDSSISFDMKEGRLFSTEIESTDSANYHMHLKKKSFCKPLQGKVFLLIAVGLGVNQSHHQK